MPTTRQAVRSMLLLMLTVSQLAGRLEVAPTTPSASWPATCPAMQAYEAALEKHAST